MKRNFIISVSVLLALALAGCEKAENTAIESNSNFELFATTVDTKTTSEGVKTAWSEGDQISAWYCKEGSTTSASFQKINGLTISDASTGKFTTTSSASLSNTKNYDWYAVYPYNSNKATPCLAKTSKSFLTFGTKLQNQTGNNSTAHISGENAPLYGISTSVAGSDKVVINMKHLTSLLKVHVTNGETSPITVKSVEVTTDSTIVGTYFFGIIDGIETISSGDSFTSKTAVLNVTNGDEIANNASADFYISIREFTAKNGNKISIKVTDSNDNTCVKEVTLNADHKFEAGKITTLNIPFVKTGATPTYTIAEVRALTNEAAADCNIDGLTVVAASEASYLVSDKTGYMYVYNALPSGISIGDVISLNGVTTSTYKTFRQVANYISCDKTGTATISETPSILDADAFTSLAGSVQVGKLCQFTGTLTISGTYYNIAISGSDYQAALISPSSTLVPSDYSGKPVTVTGYCTYLNNTFLNFIATKVELNDYLIPSSTQLDLNATSQSTTVAVESSNTGWTVSSSDTWVSASNSNNTAVNIIVEANTGSKRTATITLTSADNKLTATITVNQASLTTGTEYTFTITTSDFNTTSYAANNGEHTSTAVCTTDATKTLDIKWTSNQVMLSSGVMQFQKNNAYIYNSTDLGTISSVAVTSTAGTFTKYYGTSEHPTSGTSVGNGYFTISIGNATGKASQIVVTFSK